MIMVVATVFYILFSISSAWGLKPNQKSKIKNQKLSVQFKPLKAIPITDYSALGGLPITDFKGEPGSGWIGDVAVFTGSEEECTPSMATGPDGSIYVAFSTYYAPSGIWAPFMCKSSDYGKTWDVILHHVIDFDHHHRFPTVSIDPYTGYLYVVLEYEHSGNDHDIYLFRSTDPNPTDTSWYYIEGDVDGDDDRYPVSACEYYSSDVNWLHIAYEHIYEYDDRDLMWMYWEVQDEQWQKSTLHGAWLDEYETWVFCKPSICVGHISDGATDGYIYIAYTRAENYNDIHTVHIDRLFWNGSKWELEESTYLDSVLTNNSYNPEVVATRDGGLVLVAYQYDFYGDGSDWDLHYLYSQDKGAIWVEKKVLSALNGSETYAILTADGEGSMRNDIGGYVHCAYNYKNEGIYFKRISSLEPEVCLSWDSPRVDNSSNIPIEIYYSTGITTQERDGSWYPCVSWIDNRNGNSDVYYTTKCALYTITTQPDTNPPLLRIDGSLYQTPFIGSWLQGEAHEVSAPSPQYSADSSIEYEFSHWSDGGSQTHWIEISQSCSLTAFFDVIGVEERENANCKVQNVKLEVYPNPATRKTVISCRLSVISKNSKPITLSIYDLSGRLIRSLPITDYRSPITEVSWDGRDDKGKLVGFGIYFAKLVVGDYKETKKLAILR